MLNLSLLVVFLASDRFRKVWIDIRRWKLLIRLMQDDMYLSDKRRDSSYIQPSTLRQFCGVDSPRC
jgi:hypothetical protein